MSQKPRQTEVSNPFITALKLFVKSNNYSAETKYELLLIIYNIITNCIYHPDNDKYKKLNTKNKKLSETIFNNNELLLLIYLLNFEKDGDYYILNNLDLELFSLAQKSIEEQLTFLDNSRKIDQYFDESVQKSYNININQDLDLIHIKPEEEILYNHNKLKKLIEQEHQLREMGGSNNFIELNYRYTDKCSAIETCKLDNWSDCNPEYSLTSDEVSKICNMILGNVNFSSAIREDFYKLKNTKIYKKCTVKLCAPDNSVATVDLKPNTTISNIIMLLTNKLLVHAAVNNLKEIKLRLGSGTAFLDNNLSLYKAGLVPSAKLHIHLVYNGSYKPEQYFKKCI